MPEGPEIFVTAQKINHLIHDKPLTAFVYNRRKINTLSIMGKTAVAEAYGKNLFFNFGEMHLLVHAGLDGVWTLVPDNDEVKLTFGDKTLYFNEPMHIGKFELMTTAAKDAYIRKLGPDAHTVSLEQLTKILNCRQKLAILLMDQKKIAGVGNYLRSELLHKVKLNPFTIANTLTSDQIQKLHTKLLALYQDIIKKGGSQYYPIFGEYGKYIMKVYKTATAKYILIQNRKFYYSSS